MVEEIIPVRILRDTAPVPEPAPARRVVAPRRTLAAPARRVVAAPRPAAAAPSTVAPRVAPAPSPAATIEAAAAPRPVAAPARLEAPRVVAPRALVATSPQAVAVARFETPSVAPAERVAPVAATSGPRVVAPTAPVAVTAPRGFADTAPASDVDYGARASVEGVASGEALAGGASAVAIDAGTEDAAHGTAVAARAVDAGGGGAGGIGTAAGGIPCSERASVHDYMTEIESRVKGEWKRFELPPDLPPNAKVVLSFVLDESGTARDIEVRSAPSAALGESCRRALVAASPFPPLQGNERCLAGRRRIATFTVPVDESFRP
ncbi:MAG: TonB C-terminal domain-containing protein [Myxococcota bacterium]